MGLLILAVLLLNACNPESTGASLRRRLTPPPTDQPTDVTPTPKTSVTQTATPTSIPTSNLGIGPDELQGIQINFWHYFPEEQITPLLRAFNQDNPWGISVTAQHFGDENLLSSAILTAEQENNRSPHIVIGYPDQLLYWTEQEKLVNLTPFVSDIAWGLTQAEQGSFIPIFWEQDMVDNTRIGIPIRRDARFLVFNNSWSKELGYSLPPISTERFMAQACAANRAMKADQDLQNDAKGGWWVDSQPETMLAWLQAFDSQPVRTGSNTYQFNTPQSEAAFTFLKSLIDETCAWVSQTPYPEEAFAAREALIAPASLGDLEFIRAAFKEFDNPDEWSIQAFPTENGKAVLPIFGPSIAITQSRPEEELAAWVFARWLISPETQAFWTRQDGLFPVSTSARELLADFAIANPQWAQVWDNLTYASKEPYLASWEAVRWALADAGTQIFRSYFTADRIQATLEELDKTAAELSQEYR